MRHPDSRIEALLGRLASPKLAAIDLSLSRMQGLLAALGNPQERLPPVVHVAGTNGKGSLLAYLTAILQAAEYSVHRYTSPHLVRFNERIVLDDCEISDERLIRVLERVAGHMDKHPVTFFEATTAAAFLAFSVAPADILLLETGLGGRLDATNVVRSPLLTAITPLSMDHMDYLGDTLAAIAAEKAGIMKRSTPCVTGPQPPEAGEVLLQAANAIGVPLYRCAREWSVEPSGDSGFLYRSQTLEEVFPLPNLAGAHQIFNAGAAIACTQHLKGFTIRKEHIAQGITEARWPARLERLVSGSLASLMPPGAELWLDGGHNPQAGEALAAWAAAQAKPVHVICGMLKTKDAFKFLKPLAPHVRSLTAVAIEEEPLSQTSVAVAEAAAAAGMREITVSQLNWNIRDSIKDIVNNEKNNHIILVCGSLYLAGNILWQNSR